MTSVLFVAKKPKDSHCVKSVSIQCLKIKGKIGVINPVRDRRMRVEIPDCCGNCEKQGTEKCPEDLGDQCEISQWSEICDAFEIK